MSSSRQPFDQDDDALLVKYIATYCPEKSGRMGNALYKQLEENAEGKWPWSKWHTWQSWRGRYKQNEHRFNAKIKEYQKRKAAKKSTGATATAVTNAEGTENQIQRNGHVPKMESEEKHAAGPTSTQSHRANALPDAKPLSQTSSQLRSYGQAGEDGTGTSDEATQTPPRISQGHKNVARKTAKKTAVLTGPSDLEEEEDQLDGDRTTSPEASPHGKRKVSNGTQEDNDSKRRKVDDEGHFVANKNRPPDRPASQSHSEHVGTMAKSPVVENTDRNAMYQKHPATATRKFPAVSHILKLLSAFGEVFEILNDQNKREKLFGALDLSPEQADEVLEYAKIHFTREEEPSADKDDMNGSKRLYPDLSEEKNAEDASPEHAVPGAWDVTKSPEEEGKESDAHISDESQDIEHVEEEAKATIPIARSPPPMRQRISNAKPSDSFFETPPPSPAPSASKAEMTQSAPLASSTPTVQSQRKENGLKAHIALPSREPPRLSTASMLRPSSSFRHASTNGRPDLDSDSDTDVTPVGTRMMRKENTQTTVQSWPPARKMKDTEHSGAPTAMKISPHIQTGVVPPPKEETSVVIPQDSRLSATQQSKILQSNKKAKDVPPHPVSVIAKPKDRVRTDDQNDDSRCRQATLKPRQTAEAGPSNKRFFDPQPPPEVQFDKKRIPDWRSKSPLPENEGSIASLTASSSDPFLTADLANRLRRESKSKAERIRTAHAKSKADRRKTFGGFSRPGPPEIDLRRKAMRSSIAAKPAVLSSRRSFSSSNALAEDMKETGIQNPSRRTSIDSTIDLTLNIPSPGVQLNAKDQLLINRAGTQFFIKSMAQNHGFSEDLVRTVFEKMQDLQETDRAIAHMRAAAERAYEELMEMEGKGEETEEVKNVSTSKVSSANQQPSIPQSVQSSPDGREIDLSTVSIPRAQTESNRSKTELQYTPGDQDSTFTRVRDQFAPPSTSRAGRYVRRQRRSSGVLKGEAILNGLNDEDEDDDSEEEEAEVQVALTPAPMRSDSEDTASSGPDEEDIQSLPISSAVQLSDSPKKSNGWHAEDSVKSLQTPRSWTKEEDEILRLGEDEDAINAITKRRGKMAVKWRIVDLNDDLI